MSYDRLPSIRVKERMKPAEERDDSPAENAALVGARAYSGFQTNTTVPTFPQYLPPKQRSIPQLSEEEEVHEPCCTYIAEDIPQREHYSINRTRHIIEPEGWHLYKTKEYNVYALMKKGVKVNRKAPFGTYNPGWRVTGVAAPHVPLDRNQEIFNREVQYELQNPSVDHFETLKALATMR